jgi:cell division protein FtsX
MIIVNNIPPTNTWELFSDKLNMGMREAKEAGDPLSSSRIIKTIEAEDLSKMRRNQETLAEVYTLDAITRKCPGSASIVNHASGPAAKKPHVGKI